MSMIRDLQRGAKFGESGGHVTRTGKAATFPQMSLPYKLVPIRSNKMINIKF